MPARPVTHTVLLHCSLVIGLLALAFLMLLQPSPAQAGPQAATFDRSWLWFTDDYAQQPFLVIDADDGQHAVFSTLFVNDDGIYPAYYAYCAAGCLEPANWSYINLGDMGMFGGGLTIGLTPEGRPRVMWHHYNLVGRMKFYYAECDGACTQPASWDVAYLWDAYGYSDTQTYFAVDPQGGVHFIYDDSYNDPHDGTFYASCSAGCTVPDNWTEGLFDTTQISTLELKFDQAGHPRMVYIPTQKFSYDDTHLMYAECNAGCDDGENWDRVQLAPISADTRDKAGFGLEFTSSGKPRLAMYLNEQLSYAWCNNGCAAAANNWTVTSLGRPDEYGEYVDLALDAQDRPHLAYRVFLGANDDDGMTYSTCTAGCNSASPTWSHALVETGDDLVASDPMETPSGCMFNTWLRVGENARFALDSTGAPHFVYEAANSAVCGGQVNMVIKGVRYATVSEGGGDPPGSPQKLFLPLLMH